MGRSPEIIILGGGPAGLQFARTLSRVAEPTSMLVIEENRRIGLPQHCTGLVSLRGLREDIRLSESVVLNKFKGALIYSPSGKVLVAEKNSYVAGVLDRVRMEEVIFEEVASSGVRALLGKKGLFLGKGRIKVGSSSYAPNLVVDARGIKGLMERLGRNGRILPALQYDIKVSKVNLDLEHVYIFLGSKYSRGFFLWIVPISEKTIRVGVASRDSTKGRLEAFLKKESGKFFKAERLLKVHGGAVYLGGTVYPLVEGNRVYIGDTAGQTKPTTGGGLVYLSRAARLLAEAFREDEISSYEEKWKKLMRKEIFLQRIVRRLLDSLGDKEFDELFSSLKDMGVENLLKEIGDMDSQGDVVKKVILKMPLHSPLLASQLLYALLKGFISTD